MPILTSLRLISILRPNTIWDSAHQECSSVSLETASCKTLTATVTRTAQMVLMRVTLSAASRNSLTIIIRSVDVTHTLNCLVPTEIASRRKNFVTENHNA